MLTIRRPFDSRHSTSSDGIPLAMRPIKPTPPVLTNLPKTPANAKSATNATAITDAETKAKQSITNSASALKKTPKPPQKADRKRKRSLQEKIEDELLELHLHQFSAPTTPRKKKHASAETSMNQDYDEEFEFKAITHYTENGEIGPIFNFEGPGQMRTPLATHFVDEEQHLGERSWRGLAIRGHKVGRETALRNKEAGTSEDELAQRVRGSVCVSRLREAWAAVLCVGGREVEGWTVELDRV